jgi:hypothetical protein
MKSIRIGVFETNSSSTHSLTICSKKQYEEWQRGEIVFCSEDEKFYTEEELREKYLVDREKWDKIEKDVEVDKNHYEDWKSYIGIKLNGNLYHEYLEEYCENYTSESGDEIVIFGVYGRDG